jgi:uncharacterized protein YjiS (DUF1127 family)
MNETILSNDLFEAAETYTMHNVARYQREAERLRSEAFARHLAFGGGALWSAVKWTAGGVATFITVIMRAFNAQRTFEALNSLSDRQLNDIGLTRDQIPARIQMVLDGEELDAPEPAAELVAVEGGKSRKPRHVAPRRRAA